MPTGRRLLFWTSLGLNALLLCAALWFLLRDDRGLRPVSTSQFRAERLDYLRSLPTGSAPVVFAGASLTHRGEWAEMLASPAVLNRGIPGDTVKDLAARVDTVAVPGTRQVFLMVGLNDLLLKRQVGAIIDDYSGLLRAIRASAPTAVVVVQSVLPTNSRITGESDVNDEVARLNRQLVRLAREHRCEYLDVAQALRDKDGRLDAQYTLDGVHLNGAGYAVWARLIRSRIL